MTNNEATGYAIVALRNILKEKGYSLKDCKNWLDQLKNEMHFQFDTKSEEEAEAVGDMIVYSQDEDELRKKLREYYGK